ncbi:putative holin-like toxin [Evansella clarkii]
MRPVAVFEALALMIMFATLIVTLLEFKHKK